MQDDAKPPNRRNDGRPLSSTEGRRVALGIDPGTAIMGYGIVALANDQLELVDYGAITTPSNTSLPERLQLLYRSLGSVIANARPTEMAIEELFFSRNVQTALAVGQARGVAILAAANFGLSVSEYSPLQVKRSIAGYGRARKEQIQEMVRVLLGLAEIPKPDDAADALALAICHLHISRMAHILETQSAG